MIRAVRPPNFAQEHLQAMYIAGQIGRNLRDMYWPEATVIELGKVRPSPRRVALALPLVSPKVTVPDPSAFAFVVALTVPALIVTPPLNVLLLLRVSVPAPIFVRLMPVPEMIPLITNVPPPA